MSANKNSDTNYNILLGEYNILKCKLESKSEAVSIMSKELGQCRSERDQFKLMADQLRERYSALRKRVEGWGPSLMGVYDVKGLKGEREQNLALLLCELKEKNKALQSEVDEYKQKLGDSQGDVKLLRSQLVRKNSSASENESITFACSPTNQRADLVMQLETVKNKYILLERDLQSLLDEKEELVTARDAYKHKVDRLNQQLNTMLRGEQRVVDIDSILMENRYLRDRLKQLEEEIAMLMTTIAKYKTLLEKKRGNRGNLRITTPSGTLFLSSKQIQQILKNNPMLELPNTASSAPDLRNLIMILFETLGDKSLALLHQRKTNKILGNRINELEKKIMSSKENNLVEFRDRAKTIDAAFPIQEASIPVPNVPNDDVACQNNCPSDKEIDEDKSSFVNDDIDHDDLDLLPTKERKFSVDARSRSTSLGSFSESELGSGLVTPLPSQSPLRHICQNSENRTEPATPDRQASGSFYRTSILSNSEDDDLPPQLQKLLMAALMDLEKQSNVDNEINSNSNISSPRHSLLKEETLIAATSNIDC